MPLLEQCKKIGFHKFHNFRGHKTLIVFFFRDLVQWALNEGRLKFSNKAKAQMQVDSDP